jgi:3-oxoacyl-[acyl-carrier-protein] synthase II
MTDYKKRVVITGMGVISCVGNTVNEFWDSLLNGKSGIDYLKQLNTDNYSCKIGGEIKNFDPLNYMDKKESKRLAKNSQFAVAASMEAISGAELDLSNTDRLSMGALIGSGSGGTIPETEKETLQMYDKNRNTISPIYVPKMLPNMAASSVSRIFNLEGYSNAVSTACAAGTQAIGEAYEVILRGDADIMIAGGSEAPFCETTLGGFCNMHALTSSNEDPKTASKPFDKNRDGFVPSEGSAVLVLEKLENAINRGKEPIAEIVGYSCTSDAYHLVQPQPEGKGATNAMNKALSKANINFKEINYINAHGTSTPANDKAETLAIKNVFNDHAYNLKINSTKSIIGHSSGAAGAMEAIACAKSISEQKIHGTIHYNTPDPECDLDYNPNISTDYEINYALSNSFGFGGHNSCIILSKFS